MTAVPTSSTACKTGQSTFGITVSNVELHNDTAVVLELDMDATALVFLPGQYVSIGVSGSGQHRLYSSSLAPGEMKTSSLIKRIPSDATSTWLEAAKPDDKLDLQGSLDSFRPRDVQRPLLFLTGGTDLAPFLPMLEVLARSNSQQPVHLVYDVTRDLSLVQVNAIGVYVARLPNFSCATVATNATSNHPRRDWVTQHIPTSVLNDGDVNVYLCGPSPVVGAARKHFDDRDVKPKNFHYEKFMPNAVPEAKAA